LKPIWDCFLSFYHFVEFLRPYGNKLEYFKGLTPSHSLQMTFLKVNMV